MEKKHGFFFLHAGFGNFADVLNGTSHLDSFCGVFFLVKRKKEEIFF